MTGVDRVVKCTCFLADMNDFAVVNEVYSEYFPESPPARSAVELGLHVSFAGILTFKNADELRGIAAEVPLERILIETDSPFLAPVPYRGKRNEPAFVVEVARTIAELHGISLEEVGRITAENARRLFLLPE